MNPFIIKGYYMSYVKVENSPYLVRDSGSKAILNTNAEGLAGYKKDRETRIKLSLILSEHDELVKRVENIQNTLALILNKLS
jgi:hypothetical protein